MPFPPIRAIARPYPIIWREAVRSASDDEMQLLDAALNGDLSLAKSLLERGVSPNCRDHRGDPKLSFNRTPLLHACATRNIAMMQLLLEHGAEPNAEDLGFMGCDIQENWHGSNSLLYAICAGPADFQHPYRGIIPLNVVELLLKYGAEPNWTTGRNVCPLHVSISNCAYDVVALLIKSGADMRSGTDDTYDSLYAACSDGDAGIVELLIKNGWNAKKIYRDTKQCTLQVAASNDRNGLEISKVLMEHGADINHRGNDGCNALFQAVSQNNGALVEYLLKNGADPNAKSWQGLTSLDMAKLSAPSLVSLIEQNGGKRAADLPLTEKKKEAVDRRGKSK